MGKRRAEPKEVIEDDEDFQVEADPDDVLNDGWKVGMYGAALVPYGSWFVVLGSSILYYAWRKDYPNKAAAINRHGWLAWLLGIVLWGAIWFLLRH